MEGSASSATVTAFAVFSFVVLPLVAIAWGMLEVWRRAWERKVALKFLSRISDGMEELLDGRAPVFSARVNRATEDLIAESTNDSLKALAALMSCLKATGFGEEAGRPKLREDETRQQVFHAVGMIHRYMAEEDHRQVLYWVGVIFATMLPGRRNGDLEPSLARGTAASALLQVAAHIEAGDTEKVEKEISEALRFLGENAGVDAAAIPVASLHWAMMQTKILEGAALFGENREKRHGKIARHIRHAAETVQRGDVAGLLEEAGSCTMGPWWPVASFRRMRSGRHT